MTFAFVFLAALLALLAVGIVVSVVLKVPHSTSSDRIQKNIEIARQRLDDLQQQQQSSVLSEVETDQLRQEIERSMLDDIAQAGDEKEPELSSAAMRVSRFVAIGLAVVIPAAAFIVYWVVGEPGGIGTTGTPEAAEIAGVQSDLPLDQQSLPFDDMIEELQAGLAQNPDDLRAWTTLAQIYMVKERFAEAVVAFGRVRELIGDSADVLIREADALAMANNGDLSGKPEELIKKALELSPENTSALWLAGLAAAARDEHLVALGYWRKAKTTVTNDESLLEIRRLIRAAEAAAGLAVSDVTDRPNQAAESIKIQVEVDPEVLAAVSPENTVFVFVRALAGPPVPLAVTKLTVGELPAEIELSDAQSMVPNMKISAFDEVVVVARIALSGTAQESSGDYLGQSEVIRPGTVRAVNVRISQRVQ